MARTRNIVGLGELVLLEQGESLAPTGLAAEIASQAIRFGHRGIAVSRVGQDQPGIDLCALLTERGVDITHVQHDPDLPTARMNQRLTGRKSGPTSSGGSASFGGHAAFDELRWDFDLEDLAQRADAVVYGPLSRRGGQTRSEEDRFLDLCTLAIKVFDLTNRGAGSLERTQLIEAVRRSDGVVVDELAMSMILPGARDESLDAAADRLLKEFNLSFVLTVSTRDETAIRIGGHVAGGSSAAEIPVGRSAHAAAIVGVLHELLSAGSEDMQRMISFASRVAAFDSAQQRKVIPDELM